MFFSILRMHCRPGEFSMSDTARVVVSAKDKEHFEKKQQISGELLDYGGSNPSGLEVRVYIDGQGFIGKAAVRQWERKVDGTWRVSVIPEGGAWPRSC